MTSTMIVNFLPVRDINDDENDVENEYYCFIISLNKNEKRLYVKMFFRLEKESVVYWEQRGVEKHIDLDFIPLSSVTKRYCSQFVIYSHDSVHVYTTKKSTDGQNFTLSKMFTYRADKKKAKVTGVSMSATLKDNKRYYAIIFEDGTVNIIQKKQVKNKKMSKENKEMLKEINIPSLENTDVTTTTVVWKNEDRFMIIRTNMKTKTKIINHYLITPNDQVLLNAFIPVHELLYMTEISILDDEQLFTLDARRTILSEIVFDDHSQPLQDILTQRVENKREIVCVAPLRREDEIFVTLLAYDERTEDNPFPITYPPPSSSSSSSSSRIVKLLLVVNDEDEKEEKEYEVHVLEPGKNNVFIWNESDGVIVMRGGGGGEDRIKFVYHGNELFMISLNKGVFVYISLDKAEYFWVPL